MLYAISYTLKKYTKNTRAANLSCFFNVIVRSVLYYSAFFPKVLSPIPINKHRGIIQA